MNIAIYKDNFDPINNYDLLFITSILNDLKIDQLWIVVNKSNGFIDFKHRLNLCKLELKEINKIKILYTDIESNYVYINNFKLIFPNDNFYYVINNEDYSELKKDDIFLLENKFIINSPFIRENLNPISKSILNVGFKYNNHEIINMIKNNKITYPFTSMNCYKYLKKIL